MLISVYMIKLIIITKLNNSNLVSVAGGRGNLQSKEATVPGEEMMGKTASGTAAEGICRETGTLFSMVATWTLSAKRTADWDTNDED
jgi:hypothetical protein